MAAPVRLLGKKRAQTPQTKPRSRAFVVAGDSHIFCLGAKRSYTGPPELFPAEIGERSGFFLQERPDRGHTADYWRMLADNCGNRDIFISYQGNEHFFYFLFSGGRPVDVYDPEIPQMVPSAAIAPRRLAAAFFLSLRENLRDIIVMLREHGASRVCILGTPPPKQDFARFEPVIRKSRKFREIAARHGLDGESVSLASPSTMLKMWRILQDVAAAQAREAGADFAGVPASALNEAGFLATGLYDYGVDGVTHANARFGRMLMASAFSGGKAA